MFRVRNPRAHAEENFLLGHRAMPPTITKTAKAVTEAAYIVFRQPASAIRQQHKTQELMRFLC